eukprot:CAMPEP_0113452238 /NCGR_PEP_ID=MMETSP0014_2-20120614/6745_1 /TAXON_ID=2857 /ORGANISM="Nitzschia sp." /LENGTH=624 /DNA_ID=CAMNT_0000343607 /DNA_START=48 /DNA_END=1922 /DNA_ORIENTATION=+ /assembly_acc=CAM_ASM_000159
MSGRGRGISNAPAWMTRGTHAPRPGGPGGPGPGGPPPPPPFDDFGRAPHRGLGGGGGGGSHRRGSGDRGGGRRGPGGGPGGGPRGSNSSNNNGNTPASAASAHMIRFHSYEEERDWVEDRRRKRKARQAVDTKFDKAPTAEQLQQDAAVVALSNPAATDFSGIKPSTRGFDSGSQQTRHARRLYVGQLPLGVTEQELHDFFRQCIATALTDGKGNKAELREDPIVSVYVNHERRFCFLEFRSVEMASACMALDGVNVNNKGQVKVKRPNDYNPASAPQVHPSAIPKLDISRLGIVSGTVEDGPNKIFIGGLHYHLTEPQIMQLLQAFGKVKSFHLVKNEPDSLTSKGYCFAEYADPNVTPIAVQGLNGMDLGGGKTLTARVAAQRGASTGATATAPAVAAAVAAPGAANLPPDVNIVNGFNVEELVDAAMGTKPMPTMPTYLDQYGMPLTRIVSPVTPTLPVPAIPQLHVPGIQQAIAPIQPVAVPGAPGGPSPLDIANAALNAFGGGLPPQHVVATPPAPQSRVLVLSNMVTDADLATDEEYNGLKEEVEEEVRKYGKLISMVIPRPNDAGIEPSAVRKIFLEYATIQDAMNADRELSGRQFGPMVVETSFFDEKQFAAKRLK